MPKPIAIIGTLDTKGKEVAFIRQQIQARDILSGQNAIFGLLGKGLPLQPGVGSGQG